MYTPIGDYIPRRFPIEGIAIAPFWGDVDTSFGAGKIDFGESRNPMDLERMQSQIRSTFPNEGSAFNPEYVFIATWDNVGFYDQRTDLVSVKPCGQQYASIKL